MKLKLITLVLIVLACSATAESPYIVSPNGQYLGNLNSNRYDPNSVNNPFGRYGNPYSPDSINNPFGRYGSPYSNESVNNPYATSPPRIYTPNSGLTTWGN